MGRVPGRARWRLVALGVAWVVRGTERRGAADEPVEVPAADAVVAEIRARMRILSEAYDAEGLTLRVRSTPENLTAIKRKLSQRR